MYWSATRALTTRAVTFFPASVKCASLSIVTTLSFSVTVLPSVAPRRTPHGVERDTAPLAVIVLPSVQRVTAAVTALPSKTTRPSRRPIVTARLSPRWTTRVVPARVVPVASVAMSRTRPAVIVSTPSNTPSPTASVSGASSVLSATAYAPLSVVRVTLSVPKTIPFAM